MTRMSMWNCDAVAGRLDRAVGPIYSNLDTCDMAARARERIRERTSKGRPRPLTRPILLIFPESQGSRVAGPKAVTPQSAVSPVSDCALIVIRFLSRLCRVCLFAALGLAHALCLRSCHDPVVCVQRTNAGCGGRSLLEHLNVNSLTMLLLLTLTT